MTFAIETVELSKQFGKRLAVAKLNLSIPKSTIFGFLGPNGAGKTTTIRMLLGLIRPTSGTGRIFGHDIVTERAAIVPSVGAIVETPAFYPYLTGRDNLRVLGLTAGRVSHERIEEVLEMVDLRERADERVQIYSLGMKQRLAIAGALLGAPQLLFLDEPTNGLDPAGTVEIRELIRQLGSNGYTIFLSSHLLNEVEQVCSEVAIVHRGQMVAQGSVSELLQQQGTSLLVEAEPLALLQSVAERLRVPAEVSGPRTATLALTSLSVPEVVNALVQAGAQVYQVTPQRTTLEQFFLTLTTEDTDALPPAR